MSEYLLVEKRCIDELVALGWSWLKPHDNEAARDGYNEVILRDEFKAAVARINGVDAETAQAVYADVLNIRDNEVWTKVLLGTERGNIGLKTISIRRFSRNLKIDLDALHSNARLMGELSLIKAAVAPELLATMPFEHLYAIRHTLRKLDLLTLPHL